MFRLTHVLYLNKHDSNICFVATSKTNYRELIHFENTNTNEDYISTVSNGKMIKVNLKLDKPFLNNLQCDVKYDVNIKLLRYDEDIHKFIYKICKISLSYLDDDTEHDQDILDSNEIIHMHKELYEDVSLLIEKVKPTLEKILMLDEPTMHNINDLTLMKNDLTLFFEKNNI